MNHIEDTNIEYTNGFNIKAIICAYLLIFLCILFYFIWKPLLLFIVPGILIVSFLKYENNIIERTVLTLGTSICFWIAAFWLLKYMPISLTQLFEIIFWSTIIIFTGVMTTFKKNSILSVDIKDIIILTIFLIIGFLRFLPLFYSITASGADMSMHSYITALIAITNGVPSSYQPILNIDTFNTFPVGFHVVGALISLLGKIESYQAAFIFTCVTYTLFTYVLFLITHQYYDWKIAFVSSLFFSFLTRSPQWFVGWGANPTIFAFVLVMLFVYTFFRKEFIFSPYTIISSLFLTGVLLSHTIIFIQAFYILSISFLMVMIVGGKKSKEAMFSIFGVITCFFLFSAPYILKINFDILTDSTLAWIQNWVRNTNHVWHGSISDFYWTIPQYLFKMIISNAFIGILTIPLSIYGMIAIYRQTKDLFYFNISFLIVSILLILNAQYWILPFSYAIYPERVALMAILPLTILFSAGLNQFVIILEPYKVSYPKVFKNTVIFLLIILTLMCVERNWEKYVKTISKNSTVTIDDIKGFEWLERNTDPTDIIETNYGDAGIWIPAILKRKVTNAHVNVAYIDKQSNIKSDPSYVFIGSKCVYKDSCKNSIEMLINNKKYTQVFQSQNMYIFRKNK